MVRRRSREINLLELQLLKMYFLYQWQIEHMMCEFCLLESAETWILINLCFDTLWSVWPVLCWEHLYWMRRGILVLPLLHGTRVRNCLFSCGIKSPFFLWFPHYTYSCYVHPLKFLYFCLHIFLISLKILLFACGIVVSLVESTSLAFFLKNYTLTCTICWK